MRFSTGIKHTICIINRVGKILCIHRSHRRRENECVYVVHWADENLGQMQTKKRRYTLSLTHTHIECNTSLSPYTYNAPLDDTRTVVLAFTKHPIPTLFNDSFFLHISNVQYILHLYTHRSSVLTFSIYPKMYSQSLSLSNLLEKLRHFASEADGFCVELLHIYWNHVNSFILFFAAPGCFSFEMYKYWNTLDIQDCLSLYGQAFFCFIYFYLFIRYWILYTYK